MNRKDVKDEKQIEYLDKINTERKDNTQKRVAHAINILKHWQWSTSEDKKELVNDAAHAVNLLEAAVEEMEWHCEWFDYNFDVCLQMNEACADLGRVMADDEDDIDMMKADVTDALIKLSKSLATLIRWDDED